MGVYLREKKLSQGQVSYYLDIYHNKTRWYEFLEIKINKNRPSAQDKEKKRLANEIRAQRENELIVQDNALIDKSKRKANFVEWFEKFLNEKNPNTLYSSALFNLKNYVGKKPLPFMVITPEWCKDFVKYLKTKVSNNTARKYAMVVFSGLEEAERKGIIQKNPFRLIEKKDRIKKQEIFRSAFTLEQLQQLVNTPCNIPEQFKQAFLFSCFTGLRWSDVNPLRWEEIITKQIDGNEEWFIYFEQEKTEGIEYLPLSEQAVEILEKRKTASDENEKYVFPDARETNQKNHLVHRRVNYSLKKWAEAAGLDKESMHFHAGRHTFATNVLEHSADGDLWTVAKLLGHRSILSTQIYAHVRDKKRASAVKSLPKIEIPVNPLKVA
ncbi:MAG TPA: site-specific integrase [Flavobacteriales bacterium]|nr:site-specific integrase [Flavobacteriales bacterium]